MKITLLSRAFLICLCSLVSASAATYVWDDPTLITGSGAIDPSGASNISGSATNSTAKATLTALSTFGAIQTWDSTWATSGLGVSNQGIVNFSDATKPDIKFTFTGDTAGTSSGTQINNSSFATSGTSSMKVAINKGAGDNFTYGLTIDFGNWNGSTFDSSANGVSAVGFTLTSGGTRWTSDLTSLTVVFRDAQGNALSTQTLPSGWPTVTTATALYFGYLSADEAISSVDITVVGNYSTLFGLDDLGFTAVPEPGSWALALSSGFLMLGALWRRRKC